MKAQGRDPPFIGDLGINFAVGFLVGDHLTAAPKTDESAVILQALFLQPGAVTFVLPAHAAELAEVGHYSPAPEFNMVASKKVVLSVEFPPRGVEVHASHSVMVMGRHFFELREKAHTARAHSIRQKASYHARGVSEAVWETCGFRIQKESCRLAGACANDGSSSPHLVFRAGGLVDIRNRFRLSIRAQQNHSCHGVGDKGQAASAHGRREHDLA